MARGNGNNRAGRRHTMATQRHAYNLISLRDRLDGMEGNDPDFPKILRETEVAAADMLGRSKRMKRGGPSGRAILGIMTSGAPHVVAARGEAEELTATAICGHS